MNAPDRAEAGRVLFVAPQPFYEDRGTPIAVRRVLEVLSARGTPVDLLTFPVGEPIDLPGLRVFRVGTGLSIRRVPVGLSLRKVLLDGLLVPALVRRLRRETYGCIHAVEEAAFPAAVAGRMFKVPVIYDMHSSLAEQLAKHRLLRPAVVQAALRSCERWLLRNVDLVVCSAGLGSYVEAIDSGVRVQEWTFPGRRADVSPDDAAGLRESFAIPAEAPVVLYSGTFESYQGVSLLIDAAAEIHARVPDAVVVLVGAAHATDLAAARQAPPWLRLVGRQPQREIGRYLAMADVLVSPRLHGRNLPLKIFDYMAAGKPIVATDCPPHRAVLDESRARLVRPTSSAVAEAIVDLLLHRDSAERLARAAQAYAEAHCGADAFADLVARVYERARRREEARDGRCRELPPDALPAAGRSSPLDPEPPKAQAPGRPTSA